MSNSTNTKHTEQLNTQSNAKDNHNSNSYENAIPMKERSKKNTVHVRTPVEGTPFTVAKNDIGYTLLMGLYALTPTFQTKKALDTYIKKNEWNLIVNVIHAMLDFNKLINTKERLKDIDDKKGPEFPFNKEEK